MWKLSKMPEELIKRVIGIDLRVARKRGIHFGAAGYAGYFASMHTFLRVLSGTLMAGTWYVIYRIKGTTQP